jgi:hypothetical protein
MVIYNAATRELTAKIVYYGPGLGGKTTNLQVLHDRLEPSTVGKLLNLSTHTDRTIYFDLLPVELGDIKGYKIRFQLATVPGQTAFNETRRVVLKGADGVVFVADSQWTMLPKNLESWQNLKDNLKSNGVSFEGMPVVVQYNKRDLTDILSVEAMQEALGLSSLPFVEAVASAGRGVTETFKLISKLTFVDLLRRLQGRRPEEANLPPARESKDDLQAWRQSLFQRAPSPEPKRPRPVPAAPSPLEEAPFETDDAAAFDAAVVEGPFGGGRDVSPAAPPPGGDALEVVAEIDEAGAPLSPAPGSEPDAESPASPAPEAAASAPSPPALAVLQEAEARWEARFADLAGRLERALANATRGAEQASGALASRLDAIEETASDRTGQARQLEGRLAALEERGAAAAEEAAAAASRLERGEQRVNAGFERLEAHERRIEGIDGAASAVLRRLEGAEKALEAHEKRVRATEDDVGMALTELTERIERLQQQVASFGSGLEALHAALEDKTNAGRREAEDIRTQLGPVLEAHGQRQAADERLLSEIDRLREGFADALAGLSEQLRRAVRGV